MDVRRPPAFDDLRTVGDLQVRVFTLAKLIDVKELANREKDLAMLPLLRHNLEAKGQGGD